MSIFFERLSQINPAVVVGFFGVLLAFMQYRFNIRKQKLDATIKILEMMHNEDARDARFRVRSINKKYGNDFGEITVEDKATLASVAYLFGLAGVLAKNKKIDLDILLDAVGESIVRNHDRLAGYAKWRGESKSTDRGTLWKDFDWIAARAKIFVGEIKPDFK